MVITYDNEYITPISYGCNNLWLYNSPMKEPQLITIQPLQWQAVAVKQEEGPATQTGGCA